MPDDSPPLSERPTRDRRAFWWTFGTCVALPIVGGALIFAGTSLQSAATVIGIYTLVGTVLAWALLFVAGLVARFTGHVATGNAMMLGALAGAVVGFSLCSGLMVVADGAGL